MLMTSLFAVAAAAMAADAQDASREQPVPRVSAFPENSRENHARRRGLTEDPALSDIEMLVMLALAMSAQNADDDMRSIVDRLKRLIREKEEARELLSAMRQEQRRLHYDPRAKHQQQAWAYSLKGLCPPGPSEDDCLLRQLRSRIGALGKQGTPIAR